MDELPLPDTFHVLLGVPGLVFSQATGWTGGAHGSAAAAGRLPAATAAAATRRTTVRGRMTFLKMSTLHRLPGLHGQELPPPLAAGALVPAIIDADPAARNRRCGSMRRRSRSFRRPLTPCQCGVGP
jgi:hypothetical protein